MRNAVCFKRSAFVLLIVVGLILYFLPILFFACVLRVRAFSPGNQGSKEWLLPMALVIFLQKWSWMHLDTFFPCNFMIAIMPNQYDLMPVKSEKPDAQQLYLVG